MNGLSITGHMKKKWKSTPMLGCQVGRTSFLGNHRLASLDMIEERSTVYGCE